MAERDIQGQLLDLMAKEFELDRSSLTPDADLRDDLDLDSLDAMDLVSMVEKRLDLRVDEEKLLKLRTVGELTDYLRTL